MRKSYINNPIKNNIHLHKNEEKNKCIHISSINKGNSIINNKKMDILIKLKKIILNQHQKNFQKQIKKRKQKK